MLRMKKIITTSTFGQSPSNILKSNLQFQKVKSMHECSIYTSQITGENNLLHSSKEEYLIKLLKEGYLGNNHKQNEHKKVEFKDKNQEPIKQITDQKPCIEDDNSNLLGEMRNFKNNQIRQEEDDEEEYGILKTGESMNQWILPSRYDNKKSENLSITPPPPIEKIKLEQVILNSSIKRVKKEDYQVPFHNFIMATDEKMKEREVSSKKKIYSRSKPVGAYFSPLSSSSIGEKEGQQQLTRFCYSPSKMQFQEIKAKPNILSPSFRKERELATSKTSLKSQIILSSNNTPQNHKSIQNFPFITDEGQQQQKSQSQQFYSYLPMRSVLPKFLRNRDLSAPKREHQDQIRNMSLNDSNYFYNLGNFQIELPEFKGDDVNTQNLSSCKKVVVIKDSFTSSTFIPSKEPFFITNNESSFSRDIDLETQLNSIQKSSFENSMSKLRSRNRKKSIQLHQQQQSQKQQRTRRDYSLETNKQILNIRIKSRNSEHNHPQIQDLEDDNSFDKVYLLNQPNYKQRYLYSKISAPLKFERTRLLEILQNKSKDVQDSQINCFNIKKLS